MEGETEKTIKKKQDSVQGEMKEDSQKGHVLF